MYSTYETKQWCMTNPINIAGPYTHPPRRIPNLSKPDNENNNFMPTWLVRVADMQLVRGSSVKEGYCALSYSWNQSGDIIVDEETGKSMRLDEGRHKIIYPGKRVPRKPRGRKRTPRKIKFVKFEAFCQQICKDFNIKYIWFDQLCINQEDKNEKQREIKRMHLVYSCAYCTLVLLPEFYIRPTCNRSYDAMKTHSYINDAVWLTRLWTLEEAILSQRLLFVGRNVHLWWYSARLEWSSVSPFLDISYFCHGKQSNEIKVSTVLEYAHQRTSTNDHDRVFALSNIFPEILQSLEHATYEHSLMGLIVEFYGLLAKRDLTILCFGDPTQTDQDRPAQKFDMPSWTGVNGKHFKESVVDGKLYPNTTFQNYKIIGKSMQLTCTSISTIPSSQQHITSSKLSNDPQLVPPLPTTYNDPENEGHEDFSMKHWTLAASIQLLGHKSSKRVVMDEIYSYSDVDDDALSFNEDLDSVSFFLPIEAKNLYWADSARQKQEKYTTFTFDLTESIDVSLEYFILSGIQFDFGTSDNKSCPVIKREGESFKAIGLCHIYNYDYFFSDYIVPEKTFIIE